jgi:hypothetical protein
VAFPFDGKTHGALHVYVVVNKRIQLSSVVWCLHQVPSVSCLCLPVVRMVRYGMVPTICTYGHWVSPWLSRH